MSWKNVTLGEGIHIKHGFGFKSEFFNEEGQYIVLTPGNFYEEGGFRPRPGKDRYYSGDFNSDFILSSNDLIIAMTEQAPGLLGSSAIISEDNKYLHNQRLGLVTITNDALFDKKFLYYLFNIHPIRGQISGSASGTKVRHTSPERIYRVEVKIPDVLAQKKIGAILSQYDDLIENNRRRIQLLEEAARLLYQEWFVRLRFPGHEHTKIVDGVPEGWIQGGISDFYDTTSGGTPSRKNPDYYTGDINWVKTQELVGGYIFETSEKITQIAISQSAAKILPKRTLLVAMYGATIGEIGILAEPAACNQACCAIIPKKDLSNEIFAYLFFKDNKMRLKSLSQGAAQNNVNQQVIREYPMILPSKNVMFQFITYVNPIMNAVKNLSLTNTNLIKARDLLLPRLMNGVIPV
ncbi:Type I restriction modification DNA specificity domain protein [anaerobic digester metagenome]